MILIQNDSLTYDEISITLQRITMKFGSDLRQVITVKNF